MSGSIRYIRRKRNDDRNGALWEVCLRVNESIRGSRNGQWPPELTTPTQ